VLLKLVAILAFMIAFVVAALWVTIELADSVAAGADDTWYLAVALTLAAALLVLIALLRSRTRAMVGFMAAATIVLAAVLATYPNGGPSCQPTSAQADTTTIPQDDTGSDIFEDVSTTPIGSASTADCS
jgi:cytochrome bd-type quinol oxidase subunit 2